MLKLTINAGDLARALRLAGRVITKRTSFSILQHVALSTDNDGASLLATDLDNDLRLSLPVLRTEPGNITLPASPLLALARVFSTDTEITIEQTTKGSATISGGTGRYPMPTLDPNDMPVIEWPDGTKAGIMTAAHNTLADALRTCRPAISTEETRYYLNGCYLDLADNSAQLIATDGHRLARIALDVKHKIGTADDSVIIETKTCSLLQDLPITGRIEIFNKIIRVPFPGGSLTARTIEGTYPDYRRVIPESTPWQLMLSGNEVLRIRLAAKRLLAASGASSEYRRHPACYLTQIPGAIFAATPIAGEGKDVCLAQEIIPISAEIAGDTPIGVFSLQYLISLCDQIGRNDTTLRSQENGLASTARDIRAPVRADVDGKTFVLMPQHAKQEDLSKVMEAALNVAKGCQATHGFRKAG